MTSIRDQVTEILLCNPKARSDKHELVFHYLAAHKGTILPTWIDDETLRLIFSIDREARYAQRDNPELRPNEAETLRRSVLREECRTRYSPETKT